MSENGRCWPTGFPQGSVALERTALACPVATRSAYYVWNMSGIALVHALEEIRRISDPKFKTDLLIENFNEEDIFEEAV